MAERNAVALLGLVGGGLIILGGILAFFLGLVYGAMGGGVGVFLGGVLDAIAAVVIGFLVLVAAGYTHYRWAAGGVVGAIVLLALGVVAWAVIGANLLILVGAVLTIIAGIILLVQAALSGTGSALTL